EAQFAIRSGTSTKQALKALMNHARDHKARGQFGRFGAAVIFGTAVFGDRFIDELNVERLLVVTGRVPRFESALSDFSRRLTAAEESTFRRLRERFETYLTLYRMRLATEARFAEAVTSLRRRPFQIR